METNPHRNPVFSSPERNQTQRPPMLRLMLGLMLCLPFVSCEKADIYTMDPQTNFDALWNIMDKHYCFFDHKEVDWDEVYRNYSTQLTDTMNRYALFDLLGEMLAELKDGHTNLVSPFDIARYWAWYENYPPNFNVDIQKKYLGTGTQYHISGGAKYAQLAGTEIGYIYYGSFSSAVSESGLNEIFLSFRNCKGLIIDVRDNGGGSLSNSDRLVTRFLDEKIAVGYIMHKTGPGHNDFSEPYPLELKPSEWSRWLRPVAVLTNRRSYSATNDFVNKMKQIPIVTILGDRTGGGSGLPFNSELPNGWIVRFSASPVLDINKQNTEDGIDPDIKVDLSASDISKGKDTLIEEAVKWLNAQSKDHTLTE
jgi:C-terminal processing protease CtpA/Prc